MCGKGGNGSWQMTSAVAVAIACGDLMTAN